MSANAIADLNVRMIMTIAERILIVIIALQETFLVNADAYVTTMIASASVRSIARVHATAYVTKTAVVTVYANVMYANVSVR